MWLRNYVSSMCLFIFPTNLTRAMFVLCNKGQDICFYLLFISFFNFLCLGIMNMTQGPLSELSNIFYIMIFLCYFIIRWQISAFNRAQANNSLLIPLITLMRWFHYLWRTLSPNKGRFKYYKVYTVFCLDNSLITDSWGLDHRGQGLVLVSVNPYLVDPVTTQYRKIQ